MNINTNNTKNLSREYPHIKDGVRYFNCCICDGVFEGWGNNPYPVKNTLGEKFGKDDWCCNDCCNNIVVPERMKEMSL